jgi:hypothetical protein
MSTNTVVSVCCRRLFADSIHFVGKGFAGIQTTTCLPGQSCCSGSLNSIVSCIPSNAWCCDYDVSVGWCPKTAQCNKRFGTCMGTMTYDNVADTSTTSPTSESSPSPSQSSKASQDPVAKKAVLSVANSSRYIGWPEIRIACERQYHWNSGFRYLLGSWLDIRCWLQDLEA